MSLRQDLLRTGNRRRQKEVLLKILLGAGILVILAGVIVFLFYIPSLRVTNVAILGLAVGDERELREEVMSAISARRYFIIPKDHLIFFPKDEIIALLKRKYRVKDFELEKDFPSGIKIEVTERETWAIWCRVGLGECLLLDKEGLAFEKAPGVSGSAILKIIDAREEDFLGKNILPAQAFSIISYLIANVPAKAGEEIKTVNIKDSGETFLLYLRSGAYLLVDDETEAPIALENLIIALNSEIKEKRSELEYLDLRFADKVFYKYRD